MITKLIAIQLNSITPAPIRAIQAVHMPLSFTLKRPWTRIAKTRNVLSANTSFGSQPHGRPQEWSAQIAPITRPAQSMMKDSSMSTIVVPSSTWPNVVFDALMAEPPSGVFTMSEPAPPTRAKSSFPPKPLSFPSSRQPMYVHAVTAAMKMRQ